LAVAVSGELPFGTVTVAMYLIVSPAGAFFGTVTCISTCGVGGLLSGTLRSHVVPVVLVQLLAVNVGVLNAGVFALGVSSAAIEPLAAADRLVYAEIRNRTVPPACTLVAEAVTVMSAAGVGGGVVLGGGVGGSVALVEPPLDPLELVLVVGVGLAVGVALGEVVAWVALGELAASVALAVLAAAVDAVAVGEAAASAVPVAPLEITKRPVARPTVTGRECADRMRTPCLWLLSQLENVLPGMLCHLGGSRRFLVAHVPIRHQNRRLMPPPRHT
jgi:hypothetical protein